MAKNRKNQAASIRFGPALTASFACLVIAGAAVGYVWQKSEIYQLGKQIRDEETQLTQLQNNEKKLGDQLALLHSPVMLDQRARELNLGLMPAQPAQVIRVSDPPEIKPLTRQLAERRTGQ